MPGLRNKPAPSASLTRQAEEFVASVLALRPRLAVFDCDGTLWAGDAGRDFLFWEIEQGVISPQVAERERQRYALYERGEIGEKEMCAEMVWLHNGLRESDLERAAERFFAEEIEHRVFPEMQQLVRQLHESGCELWAVSSTNEWVIHAGATRFGISKTKVLAACVECVDGLISHRLVRVPTDEEKVAAIQRAIGRDVDIVFGNSIHDAAMLEIARNAFVVNPTDDLRPIAQERGWKIYDPMPISE
jgi:phosphoserine phosphatase